LIQKPRLILGTAQMDPNYGIARMPSSLNEDNVWHEILSQANSAGISALDTAVAYRNAHRLIAGSSWRGEIHTKISHDSGAIRELIETRQQLNRDSLDLVYFHDSSSTQLGAEHLSLLSTQLLSNGAEAIGVSIYTPDQLEKVLNISTITHVQIPLNPLDQRFLGKSIDRALDAGKKIIARSIFLQGSLINSAVLDENRISGELLDGLSSFYLRCEKLNLQPIDACLEYVSSVHGIDGVIFGAESVFQLLDIQTRWNKVGTGVYKKVDFSSFANHNPEVIDPRTWRT